MKNAAVIGSSPLCLMQAIALARRGVQVTVFEESPKLGGAWSFADLEQISGVENACHLIENFGDAYSVLENYSGVKFIRLDPQPMKVSAAGKQVAYSQRRFIVANFLKSIRFTAAAYLASVFDFNSEKIRRLRSMSAHDRWLEVEGLYFQLVHKIPKVFSGAQIHYPLGGFSKFYQGLVDTSNDLEICFIRRTVTSVEDVGTDVAITIEDGNPSKFDRVYLSGSAQLTVVNGDQSWQKHNDYDDYLHCAYKVSMEKPPFMPQYLHYPDDAYIHRITLIESTSNTARIAQDRAVWILVQFRKMEASQADRMRSLRRALVHAGLSVDANRPKIKEVACFRDKFVSSRRRSGDSEIRKALSERIILLDSIGDLGRLVAKWKP